MFLWRGIFFLLFVMSCDAMQEQKKLSKNQRRKQARHHQQKQVPIEQIHVKLPDQILEQSISMVDSARIKVEDRLQLFQRNIHLPAEKSRIEQAVKQANEYVQVLDLQARRLDRKQTEVGLHLSRSSKDRYILEACSDLKKRNQSIKSDISWKQRTLNNWLADHYQEVENVSLTKSSCELDAVKKQIASVTSKRQDLISRKKRLLEDYAPYRADFRTVGYTERWVVATLLLLLCDGMYLWFGRGG